MNTLAFLLIMDVFQTIINLPFKVYSTFVVEEKHGFNKQTPGFFVKDSIKQFIVTQVFEQKVYKSSSKFAIFIVNITKRFSTLFSDSCDAYYCGTRKNCILGRRLLRGIFILLHRRLHIVHDDHLSGSYSTAI